METGWDRICCCSLFLRLRNSFGFGSVLGFPSRSCSRFCFRLGFASRRRLLSRIWLGLLINVVNGLEARPLRADRRRSTGCRCASCAFTSTLSQQHFHSTCIREDTGLSTTSAEMLVLYGDSSHVAVLTLPCSPSTFASHVFWHLVGACCRGLGLSLPCSMALRRWRWWRLQGAARDP